MLLTTPVDTIRNACAGGSAVISGIKLAATLHKLYRNRTSREYDSEPDLVATDAITKNIDLPAKFATCDADTFRTDTGGFWRQFERKF